MAPVRAALTFSLLTLALSSACVDAREMSSNGSFAIAGKTSRKIQKYTGLTWIGNHAVSFGAGLAMKAKLGGHVKVKARSYSFTDLLQGEFETVEVTMRDSKIKGVPFGTIHAKTDQPMKLRLFKRHGESAGVSAPILVAVNGSVSEKQVKRALAAKQISNALRFLKLDLPGLGEQRLQILDPEVTLEKDKITVKAWLITKDAPRETGVPLVIVARPVLEGDRFLMLRETKIESTAIEHPELFAPFAEELLNPLVDFGRMDRHTHALRLQTLNLSDKEVSFDGKLLLAPKPKPATQVTGTITAPTAAGGKQVSAKQN